MTGDGGQAQLVPTAPRGLARMILPAPESKADFAGLLERLAPPPEALAETPRLGERPREDDEAGTEERAPSVTVTESRSAPTLTPAVLWFMAGLPSPKAAPDMPRGSPQDALAGSGEVPGPEMTRESPEPDLPDLPAPPEETASVEARAVPALPAQGQIVRFETHVLATSLQAPTWQEAEPAAAGAPASPVVVVAAPATGGTTLKLLKLVLHPAELGEVLVSLSLRGAELHVAIEAHSGEALARIRGDETVLDRALKDAGIEPAQLTLRLAPDSPFQSSGGERRDGGAPPEASEGWGDTGGGGRDFQAPGRRARRDRDDPSDTERPERDRAHGLFL